jgi:hypothetical protein
VAVLLAVLISPAAAQSPAPQAPPPPSLISALAEQIVRLFPQLDGDVIEVQGDTVTLSLGKRDGLAAGIELELYRQGR